MKSIILLLTIVFFIIKTNAQSINISYEVNVNPSSYTGKKSVYKYILSNMSSLYYNDVNDINIFPNIDWEPEVIKEKQDVKTVKIDDGHIVNIMQEYLYKDFTIGSIIYNKSLVINKISIIEEPLQLFKWQIYSDVDTVILGFHCQKAKANFRGREYTAYFTPEISMFGGPWKFDGLPGLILSVKDKEDYFIINPISIKITANNTKINNPFDNEKNIISWDKYKDKYFEQMKDILKLSKANSSAGETTKIIIKSGIEYLGFTELTTDDL